MFHEQECRLLDPGTLPLAALDHDCHGVKVLLLGPGDDLDVVLVPDGPHVGALGVRHRLEAWHYWQIKVKQERSQLRKNKASFSLPSLIRL